MNDSAPRLRIGRRAILTGGLGLAGALVAGKFVGSTPLVGEAVQRVVQARTDIPAPPRVHLAATDGWVSIADPARTPPIGGFWPDPVAPAGRDLYVFGFRDVSGMSDADVKAQRGKAQISAPILAFDEDTHNYVTLTNLGLLQRPDLTDGHTVHFHGFQNAIPLFDGVPDRH